MSSPIMSSTHRGISDRRASFVPAASDTASGLHPSSADAAVERLTLAAALAAANAQASFNRLVADVAARFNAVAADAVDDAIVETLRQTADALQLDWAVLWGCDPGEEMAIPSPHCVRASSALVPEPVAVASIPSMITALQAGTTQCFATVNELPAGDRDVFRGCGLRSGVLVPLPPTGDEGVVAALAFGSTTR